MGLERGRRRLRWSGVDPEGGERDGEVGLEGPSRGLGEGAAASPVGWGCSWGGERERDGEVGLEGPPRDLGLGGGISTMTGGSSGSASSGARASVRRFVSWAR